MSRIFISHNSADNDATDEFVRRLEEKGHKSVYVDFYPDRGIPAGRDWEQDLYRQLRACQGLIILCSPASMNSMWCFAEVTHAKALGKPVFPVKIAECDVHSIVTSLQIIDYTSDKEQAFERLWRGLKAAGIDSDDQLSWDDSRSPYPGLLAFQEQDAAIYFGREAEIQAGLESLNQLSRFGGASNVLVLGPSGSGKSSLLRAGLVPRLRANRQEWIIVDPFRPREQPLKELALALGRTCQRLELDHDWRDLREELQQAASSQPVDTAPLRRIAEALRESSGYRDAKILLSIDQAEELLGVSGSRKQYTEQFISLIQALAGIPDNPFLVVWTLRSDFLSLFQQHPQLGGLATELLRVGPMDAASLSQVIEGPANLAGVRLEAGLTQKILGDMSTDDALPLLAFTLRELYERHAKDGVIDIAEYQQMGGLEGSVARAAEQVYQGMQLSAKDEKALRHAFSSMVRIKDDMGYARKPASRDQFPGAVGQALERFVQARLIVAGNDSDENAIEISHEALFRSWGRLKRWLDNDRQALIWEQRLRDAVAEWERTGRDPGALLRGAQLVEAENQKERQSSEFLSEQELEFLQASIELRDTEREKEEAQRKERERMQKQSNRRLRIFLVIALLLVAGAGWQWREAVSAKEQTINETIATSWKAVNMLEVEEGWVWGLRNLEGHLRPIFNLEKLRTVSPEPIFLTGPHGEELNLDSCSFGRYNPAFIQWAQAKLIPDDPALQTVMQAVYDKYMRGMARVYYIVYRDLKRRPELEARLEEIYRESMYSCIAQLGDESVQQAWGGRLIDSKPNYSLYEPSWAYARHVQAQIEGMGYPVSIEEYWADNSIYFWLRRTMDGTEGGFADALEKLLQSYDQEFLSRLPPPNDLLDIMPDPEQW